MQKLLAKMVDTLHHLESHYFIRSVRSFSNKFDALLGSTLGGLNKKPGVTETNAV